MVTCSIYARFVRCVRIDSQRRGHYVRHVNTPPRRCIQRILLLGDVQIFWDGDLLYTHVLCDMCASTPNDVHTMYDVWIRLLGGVYKVIYCWETYRYSGMVTCYIRTFCAMCAHRLPTTCKLCTTCGYASLLPDAVAGS
jgi:hypothetical protein